MDKYDPKTKRVNNNIKRSHLSCERKNKQKLQYYRRDAVKGHCRLCRVHTSTTRRDTTSSSRTDAKNILDG